MSKAYATSSLSRDLDRLDFLTIKQLVLNFCQNDSLLRAKVSHQVQTLLAGQPAVVPSSPSPPRPSSASRASSRPSSPKRPQSSPGVRDVNGSRQDEASFVNSPSPSRPESRSSKRSYRPDVGSLFSRLPDKVLRIRVHRNGNPAARDAVSIAGKTLAQMLELATAKLNLTSDAKRLFDFQGNELSDLSSLWTDATVYVSCGEPFADPTAKPEPRQRASSAPPRKIKETLEPIPRKFITAFRNGEHIAAHAVRIPGHTIDEILRDSTRRLQLSSPARYAFTEDGREIVDTVTSSGGNEGSGEGGEGGEQGESGEGGGAREVAFASLENGTHIFISVGEPFRDPNSTMPVKSRIRPLPETSRLLPPAAKHFVVYINGTEVAADACRVAGHSLPEVLHLCTSKLNLSVAAKKLYTREGQLVVEHVTHETPHNPHPGPEEEPQEVIARQVPFSVLENGTQLWVSTGEPFRDPASREYKPTPVRPLPEGSRLVPTIKKRLHCLVNGESLLRRGVKIVATSVDEVLWESAPALGLGGNARLLYIADGRIVVDRYEDGDDEAVPKFPRSPSPMARRKEIVQEMMEAVGNKGRRSKSPSGAMADEVYKGRKHMPNMNSLTKADPPMRVKLKAGGRARCVALAELEEEQLVWVSCGEPHKPLTASFKEYKSNIPEIPRDSKLVRPKKLRLTAFKNGWFNQLGGRHIVSNTVKGMLDECTTALGMTIPAKLLFDLSGRRITNLDTCEKDQIVFASSGEPFKPTNLDPEAMAAVAANTKAK